MDSFFGYDFLHLFKSLLTLPKWVANASLTLRLVKSHSSKIGKAAETGWIGVVKTLLN